MLNFMNFVVKLTLRDIISLTKVKQFPYQNLLFGKYLLLQL